jgi:hypothetical protein
MDSYGLNSHIMAGLSELLHSPFNQLGANKPLENNILMGLTALTVDEMVSGFWNTVFPLVTVEPTFEDITNTQKVLNANSITIPSLSGGGRHGHLGLIMTVKE